MHVFTTSIQFILWSYLCHWYTCTFVNVVPIPVLLRQHRYNSNSKRWLRWQRSQLYVTYFFVLDFQSWISCLLIFKPQSLVITNKTICNSVIWSNCENIPCSSLNLDFEGRVLLQKMLQETEKSNLCNLFFCLGFPIKESINTDKGLF